MSQQQQYNNYQHQKKQSVGIKAIKPNIVNNLANRFEHNDTNIAPAAQPNNAYEASDSNDLNDSSGSEEGSNDSSSSSDSISTTEEQTMFIESEDTMIIEDSKEDISILSKISQHRDNDDEVLKGMRITPQMINNNYSNSDIFGSMDGRIKFQNIDCTDDVNTPISTGSMVIHNNLTFDDVKLDLIIDHDMIISDDEELNDQEINLKNNMENVKNKGRDRQKHQPRQTTMEFHKHLSMNVVDNNTLLDDVVNDIAAND
eukprot:8350_1